MNRKNNLFSVRSAPLPQPIKILSPIIDRMLCIKQLGDLYATLPDKFEKPIDFVKAVHEKLNVTYSVAEGTLDRIPKTGPLVVVSNHPFGGIEATLLLQLLSEVRPDVKFMANYLLGKLVPETNDFCIFVDPFGGSSAPKMNMKPLKDSISWVKNGGALCIFPSGTVSHLHLKRMEVSDPIWSPTVSRIIRKSGAVALPIFFPGRNDAFFQTMGLIHPRLRTLLLGRELYNKIGKEIRVKIGNVIPHEKLQTFASDEDMISYLRLRTYILGNVQNFHSQIEMQNVPTKNEHPTRILAPIIDAVDPELLQTEINKLPSRNTLLVSGDLQVYCARFKQIPNIMREIGRLREITFRQVHEGTGKEIDLDDYDNYYIHLFIWNKPKKEIVGAYRLAKADRVLRRFGVKGLYSSTLFDYKTGLLQEMGPALELGRSFIRSEYQRNYSSLLLLWKGIGAYVLANPRYKILFGPVSINNEYDSLSRELIKTFLKANNYLPELAKMIKAKNPMGRTKILGMDIQTTSVVVKDLNDVSDLLNDIEARQKAVPILLKQYLRVGGKMLGFNIDTSFGDVLDGLIFVDLLDTEPNLLDKIFGKEGCKKFLDFHKKTPNL